MSTTETLVGWNLNSDHPLSQAKYQPIARTPLVVLENKFTFLIQKCVYLIKVRVSQSSHWWERGILGSQDNTHITKIQPGPLTRKRTAVYSFLQITNHGLCSDSGIRDHFTFCKTFQHAILNTTTSHSRQLRIHSNFPC